MHFFRNPEIKKDIWMHLILTALVTASGFFYGQFLWMNAGESNVYRAREKAGLSFAGFLLLPCLAFLFLHLFITYRRYRSIRLLCREIDQVLHDMESVRFFDYSEGELSILKIEIDKMLIRLREQSKTLQEDKLTLAASLADISHQLRTPLTSIRLLLSLLSEPDLSWEKRRSLIQQLSRLISRIDWLIEALLKLSRLDAKTVTLHTETVSVSRLVTAAAEPLEIPMELKEQHFSFTPKTRRESFQGDFSWTVEALGNILKNCMEHTPFGGNIQIFASENAIFTEILIEDDGPGFTSEDLSRLFERFYKGKHSKKESIGIGLALSQRILSLQNATIKAENRLEGGARFILHFYKNH